MSILLQLADVNKWRQVIPLFDKTWRDFNENYNKLILRRSDIYDNHPSLIKNYDELTLRAADVYGQLEKLKDTRNSVVGWLSKIGIGDGSQLNGLGAIPVVAVGVGIVSFGAIVALTVKWLKDFTTFNKKYVLAQKLIDDGVSPSQIPGIISKTFDSGFGSNIKWIVIGGAALIVLPTILSLFRKR